MFELLKKLITSRDLEGLFSFCSNLAEEERLALLDQLQHSPWGIKEHKRYDKILVTPDGARYEYLLAVFLLTRSLQEYEKQPINTFIKKMYCPTAGELFSNSKASYVLPKLLQEEKYRFILELYHALSEDSKENIPFETYWTLYKAGEIPLDEPLFLDKSIIAFSYSSDKINYYTHLVLNDQEFQNKIFRRLHRYESGMHRDAKLWEEVFVQLQEQGYVFDRQLIGELLESLLNPWKKPQLNWHCRWITFLAPTEKEIIDNQERFFALLSTGNDVLVNFAMKWIQKISKSPLFHIEKFQDSFVLCLPSEKTIKSQLAGLTILEKYYHKNPPEQLDSREQLIPLFTQPDIAFQQALATLLVECFYDEKLWELITPYTDFIKPSAREILQQKDGTDKEIKTPRRLPHSTQRLPLSLPKNWDELLFLIGDSIRERSAATIDLLIDGIIRLQTLIPKDLKKVLAPYHKQLNKSHRGYVLPLLKEFLLALETGGHLPLDENLFLFLRYKMNVALERITKKCTLPLLSTPTIAPFYTEAAVLVEKLLSYEQEGVIPDFEDLTIACNRLLLTDIPQSAKEKSQLLQGDYAQAIQYALGVTSVLSPTEETLPLWTQITRIKHPEQEFPEFSQTTAKDIPSVVNPYYIGYGWQEYTTYLGEVMPVFVYDFTRYNSPTERQKSLLPEQYYNAGGGAWHSNEDFEYTLSLCPQYPDGIICSIFSHRVGWNALTGVYDNIEAIETLLKYQLPLYHSGWLYIGACLFLEKRPYRDLAYEYICWALEQGKDLTYLANYVAYVLATGYAPIKHFLEMLDRPNLNIIKGFANMIINEYLRQVEGRELPKLHKRLLDYQKEISHL